MSIIHVASVLALAGCSWLAHAGQTLFETDFQKAELDKAPAELLVLDGGFVVKAEGDGKFLELPGAPLETYGVLTLPKENLKDNVAIAARILGTSKGRRAPAFSVGLGGAGGYRLQVSPGKKALELLRSDALKTTQPFDWKSGEWLQLKLQVRKLAEGGWRIEGKAWPSGSPEPAAWTLSFDDKEEPPAGRPSLWGCPYAGTPIRYDDVKVTTLDAR